MIHNVHSERKHLHKNIENTECVISCVLFRVIDVLFLFQINFTAR